LGTSKPNVLHTQKIPQKVILGMLFLRRIRAVVTFGAITINTNKLTKTKREVWSIDTDRLIESARATFLEADSELFVKRTTLSSHTPYDCKIKFIPKKIPKSSKLRILSATERQLFSDYAEEMLQKGQIWKTISEYAR
jgi:nicotinamide riboside kinase